MTQILLLASLLLGLIVVVQGLRAPRRTAGQAIAIAAVGLFVVGLLAIGAIALFGGDMALPASAGMSQP